MSSGKTTAPDIQLSGFSIWVLGREFPDSADYWDGNWLNVRARAEAFGAVVQATGAFLRTDELAAFADQVKAVYRDVKGVAELTCLEPELNAKVSCDELGHITLIVELTPDHIMQSHRFEFEIDQTYLPAFLAQCAQVLERFPIKDAEQVR